ncbi:MAG TPA: hypothetical protein VGF80_07350 [Galbitalea sp.]|jgi:hypothetical protein
MSKVATALVLVSCIAVLSGLLTGCSAGALPVGSARGPGATSAPTKPPASAPPDSDDLTAVPQKCPSAAEVAALVGFAVPDPQATSSGAGLACTYASSDVAHDMQINFHPTPSGTTAETVKAELAGSGGAAPVSPVAGLGDAAFSASPPEGGAALLVWNKGVEFSIVDAQDVDGLRRVALGILSD